VKIDRRTLLSRILAGTAITPWTHRSLARTLGYPRLLEGPMVGAPSPVSFTVWARASDALDVQVEYSTDPTFNDALVTPAIRAEAAHDLITVHSVKELKPSTTYYYRMLIDGARDRVAPVSFHTRTAPAGAADFRVAYGSCARTQVDIEQTIFSAISMNEPDLFFWLGDNIYADTQEPTAMADLYRRQRAVVTLQPLIRTTPQLAIWDDHDFGYNDADSTNPIRDESLRVFNRYWANPSGGVHGTPGVFFQYTYGGVDFFFLDGRYHRSPRSIPDGAARSMLGAGQKQWLKDALRASRAPFKILISGTGWTLATRDGTTWGSYLHERNELFDFIRDERIEGVVCLSGDQHFGELNCIPWSARGGYDIYDLVSSPLAQFLNDRWPEQTPEQRIRRVYARSVNFGMLSFQMSNEPTLTFTLHDVRGGAVWKPLVLRTADLRNGVKSWDRNASLS
jgi:alkaline phosphatase D